MKFLSANELLSEINFDNLNITYTEPAWARPTSKGKYGERFMTNEISSFILEAYEAENKSKSMKASEWQLLEKLKANNQHKFCLPNNIHALRTEYSRLGARTKKYGKAVGSSSSTGRGRRSAIPESVRQFINNTVNEQPDIKPKAVEKMVYEQFQDLDPTLAKTVKTRVSNCKTKLKSNNSGPKNKRARRKLDFKSL